jgi:DnaJ-class molecular chaperone
MTDKLTKLINNKINEYQSEIKKEIDDIRNNSYNGKNPLQNIECLRIQTSELEEVLEMIKIINKGMKNCPDCKGKGKFIVHEMDSYFEKCERCNGTGLIEDK